MSEQRTSVDMNYMAAEFADVYFIKLLFEEPIAIDAELVRKKLIETFHHLDTVMEDQGTYAYALLDHMVSYANEEKMPAQVSIMEQIPFYRDTIQNELIMSQCWGLNEPQELLERCQYEIMIHDFLAGGLERVQRANLLANFVDAMLSLYPQCIALYFPHAQKFISKEQFIHTGWNDEALHFLDGGLQIRFFHIQDTSDMVIDSVGLTALGLPDIQCHFHELDPNAVVNFVANLASYLFMSGDVIQDKETVEGFAGTNHKWVCQHEDALIMPKRIVLDIQMSEFASGNRN